MPQIRAEQVFDLTLKDLQIAEDANIKQSKIEDWQSDPAGWISKGIIKPVTTANLPAWDGSQAGEFYYDINTNELFFGISTDPYYQVIMGSNEGGAGGYSDKILVIKMTPDAENWTGTTAEDTNGSGSRFSLGTSEVSVGGENLTVYLNGVLQELGDMNDYILIEEEPRDSNGDLIVGADPVDKIVFNYQVEGPEQKITAIIHNDATLVNYATKAYVESKFAEEIGTHYHTGNDSPQISFNNAITTDSLSAIIHDIIPASGTVNLGSAASKFGAIYAHEGHFDATTIYLGNVALRGLDDTFEVSKDGTTYYEVPLSGSTSEPAQLAAGAGQPIILKSDSGITAKGDILPDMTGAIGDISIRNIGSETQKFNSIYADEVFVGASSLYVNGKKVIQDIENTMTFQTDQDQAMVIKTDASALGSGQANLIIDGGNEVNLISYGGVELTVRADIPSKHINLTNNSSGGNITVDAIGTNANVQISAANAINLDATTVSIASNVNVLSMVTATQFSGPLTGNVTGAVEGNATTASALQTPRTIELTGDVTGSAVFDGSANTSIAVVVADDSHTHDTRYYTETESDTRFVNVTGDTMTGDLTAPTFIGALTGNASSASALEYSRNISLTGAVSGTVNFNGTSNVTMDTAVANDSHTHDTRYYTETESDARFVKKNNTGEEIMQGSLTVQGNLTVSGTTTTVNTEQINLADNIITLNSNYSGSSPSEDSGIEVERGTQVNYQFMFDEATDTFVIGMVGDLQPVATRETTPTANAIPFWNSAASRLDSSAVTVSGSTLTGSVTGNSGTATKLATSRTISLTGDASGSVSFDGSANASITVTVANNSHTHTSANISDASTASTPSVAVLRDGSGDINARLFRSEYDATNPTIGFVMTQVDTASNNFIRPSTTAQLAAQMETDNVILKYNGGTAAAGNFYTGVTNPTATNRMNYDGYFYATRVYNAVYNDLAEFMIKASDAEPGEVLIMTENGVVPSRGRGEKAVVGVYSDTFGQALGADDQENKLPVGLSGRVNVWISEPCEIGDLLISGDKPGFASVKRSGEDGEGRVIGKVMQNKTDSDPERVSMLIVMK